MALWLCEGTEEQPCRTLYAVGLFRCPRCHGTDFHEFGSQPEDEEHPMAKITQHGGPSDKTLRATEDAADEAPAPDTHPEPPEDDTDAHGPPEGESGPEPVDEPDEVVDLRADAEEAPGTDEEPAPQETPEPDTATVREWARDNGYEVSVRGKIPAAVMEAYREAHPTA